MAIGACKLNVPIKTKFNWIHRCTSSYSMTMFYIYLLYYRRLFNLYISVLMVLPPIGIRKSFPRQKGKNIPARGNRKTPKS